MPSSGSGKYSSIPQIVRFGKILENSTDSPLEKNVADTLIYNTQFSKTAYDRILS